MIVEYQVGMAEVREVDLRRLQRAGQHGEIATKMDSARAVRERRASIIDNVATTIAPLVTTAAAMS
ncbi:hypothetical protein [Nocardia tenerifensis]|uniref:hypothetical protein n=1 Tax=Nocardia tenerifensis TaxID=228006 RepID=UPI0011B47861|nr:hypothetical protein [Nocardia tenerifensis]